MGLFGGRRPPAPDARDVKIAELEARVMGLEIGIIEVCRCFKQHVDTCNRDFDSFDKAFLKLVNYVVRPSKQIMGDGQEVN